MYKISRHGGDVVVLSRKYIDELQNAPLERLSSIKGLIKARTLLPFIASKLQLLIAFGQNFGGRYSGIDLLAESDIGTRALQVRNAPGASEHIVNFDQDKNHAKLD